MRLSLGERDFGPDDLIVMAIVNRTPDSFYDQGATFALSAALDRIDRAVSEGADIVDVGGVKAGHGEPVSVEEEILGRSHFEAIRRRHPDLVISVDTYRSGVARRMRGGRNLINDTWAGADPEMPVVAAAGGPDWSTPCGRPDPTYRPASDGVRRRRGRRDPEDHGLAERAVADGVRPSDPDRPDHDFGKNTWHSLELTRPPRRAGRDRRPVLVRLSPTRTSSGRRSTSHPVSQRSNGTIPAALVFPPGSVLACSGTHDVRLPGRHST